MKNKARLNKAKNSRIYTIILKSMEKSWGECIICSKRRGRFHQSCTGPINNKKERENLTWKKHRKTQWKE